ncbi:MAG: hypothetical protein HQL30_04970 [Candidatus Omnitrophica bacterium]|nr:hypothetical protein [Candidatus Omnitrophota bacterium]
MKKQLSLLDKAELAMKKAIKSVLEKHRKSGRPLAIWENGRVRKIIVK